MRTIELDVCTLTFVDEDIVHAHFKDGHTVSPEEVHAMFEAIASERKGRKALLVVSVGVNSTLSNEARTYASSPESSKYIAADAIVVRDFGHQLTANVFVRYNKPQRPIQLFGDMESAIVWLGQHRDLVVKA
ncbi:MAG: hypothetical protein ABI599_05645 [Flavobacteriales bacterium]